MCFLVKSNITMKRSVANPTFRVLPKSEQLFGITVYLVDENNWYGIMDGDWMGYKFVAKELNYNIGESQWFNFKSKVTKVKQRHGLDNVTRCLEYVLAKVNCTVICYPITFNFLHIPPCENYNQTFCMENEIYTRLRDEFLRCLDVQSYFEYNTHVYKTFSKLPNETNMNIQFTLDSLNQEIKDEVLVINGRDFVGSVGGSLGLFVGFSFYNAISYMLTKFFNKDKCD